jgi:hypothetical protein
MVKHMMTGALILSAASPALADDDNVAPRARASVLAALKRAGCTSPAKIEHDDGGYEVDRARCRDGIYDVELSGNFKILRREREDHRDHDDHDRHDRHDRDDD